MLRRGLQVAVGIFGVVATVAGLVTVVAGAAGIVGGGPVSPTVDSEIRFYSVWYVLVGLFALRAVPRVEVEGFTIRLIFGALFVGGLARLLSLAVAGSPHVLTYVLLGLELVIPPIVLPWQAAVARRHR